MDDKVLKELKRIASQQHLSEHDLQYLAVHLTDLLAEIVRLGQYERKWEDMTIWIKQKE